MIRDLETAQARLIDFGESALRTITSSLRHVRCPENNKAGICALALHATIIELFAGCLSLAKTSHATGIPILLRSLYEALVDLDNLVRDHSYYGNIEAANLSQLKRLLQEARTNPLLDGLDKVRDVEATLTFVTQRLATLEAGGNKKPLKIEERCRRVGRLNEYRTLYGLFCMDSHNNLSAIEERHFDDGPETFHLTVLEKPHIPSLLRRLSTATGYLIQSAGMVHGAFQTEAKPQIENVESEYRTLRNELLELDQRSAT